MTELAEGARLEIVCTPKRCTEGSNPSLSAKNVQGRSAARAYGLFYWDRLYKPEGTDHYVAALGICPRAWDKTCLMIRKI